MTDIFADMREAVLAAVEAQSLALADEVRERITVSPAREAAHGDMVTNAALVAATQGRKPRQIAEPIAAALRADPRIGSVDVAGPGFINIRLRSETLLALLPAILRAGEAYGDSTIGGGCPANVEYVSTNPTGPVHVGHCRGAVVGDALANLLVKAGYAVTKEFYINDAGAQVTALAWAAYWRYLQAIGTPLTEQEFAAEVPGGLQYGGDYLVPVGAELAAIHGAALATAERGIAAPEVWLSTVRDFTLAEMMREIRADLALLGVHQDVFSSERALVESGAADAVIAQLAADGLIYEGVLEPPKGKAPEDWEPRPQTLFRSTTFGDDTDRPLRKSDGSNTYFANDIAYHADKLERGFRLLIDVLGADHGGYVPRLKAAVRALSHGEAALEAVLCQIVHVVRGGQPVPMSKRAGTYVTVRDLIEEVGRDAVRFTMLTRKADAQMEFDLDQVVAQTRDNPVFYVQYAHARCRSVLRAAAEMFGAGATSDSALAAAALEGLGAEPELAVIRRLAQWPRVVQAAALAREPHRIAFFLYDLAADFHMLWNRGKDDSTLRFLQAGRQAESLARLALVAATAVVIRSGLAVMGVTPVEEMR
ncbi:MAG TPA: arginine--tRNA ligase [Acetobacteraceae bacterium]|nr:arginine--tRNA ligase [Acetobacteraceae bacterium]